MSAERALLDALEYDPDVELPGPKLLESTCDALLQAPDIIRRRAALAVNDILRSELPLRFPAAVLAEGAVAVAYMVSRIPLPASQQNKDGGGEGSSSLSSGVLRAQTAELDEIKATLQANAEFAMARKGQATALAATSTSTSTSEFAMARKGQAAALAATSTSATTSAVACRAVPLTQSTPVPTASAPPRPSPVDVPVSQAEVLAVPPPQPPRPTTIRVGSTSSTTPPPGGGLS